MMISKAFASSVALVLLLSCAPAHGKRGNRPQEAHETLDLEEIPNNVTVMKTATNTAEVGNTPPPPPEGICSEGSRSQRLPCPQWSRLDVCLIPSPGGVDKFRIKCRAGGTYLQFYIADGGWPGDHWQLKGKLWDIAPNTAVTTSPGGTWDFGAPGRVYTYVDPPGIKGGLDALVECSYLHGRNDFPAGSFVYFTTDGTRCTLEKLAPDVRIDRCP